MGGYERHSLAVLSLYCLVYNWLCEVVYLSVLLLNWLDRDLPIYGDRPC